MARGHGHTPVERLADRIRHALGHEHDHDSGALVDSGAAGLRATKVSLLGLGLTAAIQAAIVAVSGSVALLSDTVHNLTDALTALPLWAAFSLGRRQANRRYTLGYHRFEDLVGLVILVAIALSAVGIVWESFRRLLSPEEIDHIPLVIAAGLVGALGNELVAAYRIRVGRRIHSEALIADGHHAHSDALTSMAVVAAGIGAALGWAWVDPAAGLIVGLIIVVLLRRSGARIFGRLLDAVDPELVDRAETAARAVPGVEDVTEITMRWQGHRLLATVATTVDPTVSVAEGHSIGEEVRHALLHEFSFTVEALVHVDPAGDEAHAPTEHHRRPPA